jgi:hypothetical protein
MIRLFKGSTEYTSNLSRAIDTALSIAISSGDSTLEVRSDTPLSQLFFDALSTHDCTALDVQYWNGSAFASVTNAIDDTDLLKRYGFIKWTNPTDQAKSGDYYLYRFALSGGLVSPSSIAFRYIGIVFCQQHDITGEMPDAADYKPDADASLIRFIVGAKCDIVQRFRNTGKNIFNLIPKDITEFHFLDPSQLTSAAKYLALSKLAFYRSDKIEDVWLERSKHWAEEYNSAIQLFFLTIDEDEDGKAQPGGSEFQVHCGVIVRE